jgi:ribosome maturation factor RimP
MGEIINIKTIRPIDGRRDFTGELIDFKQGQFTVKTDENDITFTLAETSSVKLADTGCDEDVSENE